MNKTKNKRYYLLGVTILILLFYAMYLYVDDEIIMPSLSTIINHSMALLTTFNTYKILSLTLLRLIITLLIGIVFGVLFAILANYSSKIEYTIHPFIVFIKTIPLISIIVVVLMILGKVNAPYLITFLGIFPIIYETTKEGIKESIMKYKDVYLLESNLNIIIIKKILLPQTANFFIVGLLQSIGLGLKILIMAEFLSQTPNSIGRILYGYYSMLEYAGVFSFSILLILIILVIEVVLNKLILKVKNNIY